MRLLIMGMCVCMHAYRTDSPIHACGVTVSVMPTRRSGDRPFSTLLCTGSGNTCVPKVLQHCHAFTVLQCTEIDGLCSVSVDCPTWCMAVHTIRYVRTTYILSAACCSFMKLLLSSVHLGCLWQSKAHEPCACQSVASDVSRAPVACSQVCVSARARVVEKQSVSYKQVLRGITSVSYKQVCRTNRCYVVLHLYKLC